MMAKQKGAAKFKKITIPGSLTAIDVYGGAKIQSAVKHFVNDDTSLYDGVKFAQVIEAIYEAGRRDGRAEAVTAIDQVKKSLDYRKPGRPKK